MSNGPREYTVYALVDPRDRTIHYVGMTYNAKRRYTDHMRCDDGNQEKARWVQGLRRSNFLPEFLVLDVVQDLELAKTLEDYWVGFYQRADQPLANQLTMDLYWRGRRRGEYREDQSITVDDYGLSGLEVE